MSKFGNSKFDVNEDFHKEEADHAEELARLLEKLRDGGDNALSVYWHDIDKALTNYREATK